MTRRFGFELLQDQIIDRLSASIALKTASAERAGWGDTPIEKLFYTGLKFYLEYCEPDWFTQMFIIRDEQLEGMKRRSDAHSTLFIQTQTNSLVDWRADFVINVYAGWKQNPGGGQPGWQQLIVECDGHDFHERTKEQAARDRERDRSAQLAGIEIFRFTGSELWRNPLGCAEQVIKWADRRY